MRALPASYSHISTRLRDHFLIGLALGLWLYLFLAVIGPFDAAELPLRIRVILMACYGLVFCLIYLLCIPWQNWWYSRNQAWSWWSESIFILAFCLLCLPASYRYYTTEWVRGDWGFQRFTLEIYLPTLVIIIPVLIFARRILAQQRSAARIDRHAGSGSIPEWELQGDNRHDLLRLNPHQLLALSAANNYVTVYYLDGDTMSKKVLRTTLKKVQEELPELVQIHRSHLVNPLHFRQWKDSQTLLIGPLELPVSKTYKARLQAKGLFTPK